MLKTELGGGVYTPNPSTIWTLHLAYCYKVAGCESVFAGQTKVAGCESVFAGQKEYYFNGYSLNHS